MQATHKIVKLDAPQRVVYAWASVITDDDGNAITDSQGDIITPDELTKAAHDFVLYSRTAGEMHQRLGVGRVVAALPLTSDIRKAFGLGDSRREGLIVGFKVDDEATWQRVASGELGELSIGGAADRVAA